ncbi:MAG: hypothetical protein NC081_01660 [Roseburia sp.]|nr:hypothetical protein [Roseburia sp.]
MKKFNVKQLCLWIGILIFITSIPVSPAFLFQAHAREQEGLEYTEEARAALREAINEREIMAVVYLCREYDLKKEADSNSETAAVVSSGQTVFIRDVGLSSDNGMWLSVSFYRGDEEYQGYIEREYLACSDERFAAWEEAYSPVGSEGAGSVFYSVSGNMTFSSRKNSSSSNSSSKMLKQFPESYRPALEALLTEHPNWIFVPLNTGLNWETVIDNELTGAKSLVHYTFPEYTKEGVYDDNNWYYASRAILEYYMDPRNGLTEDGIFQFEQLTYNESYHTREALEVFLDQTFMNSKANAPDTNKTYGEIFYNVGKAEGFGVSPFHLAARVYQEQGKADAPMISGTYPGFEHLYNHFNIGATGRTTKEVIENGLTYARNAKSITNPSEPMPWKDSYYSIMGGAHFISANYIRKGQDSLYLQKFNVNPSASHALYTHQYMQNISAPASEAKKIRDMYQGANSLDCAFVFTIPVFNNMPEDASAMPVSSKNVVLKIPEGFDGDTIYLDGVPFQAEKRNGYSIVKAKNTKAKVAEVYQYNASGVPVDMYVWTLNYKNKAYAVTEQPKLQNLLSYHGFSIRITGKSGIRFKTGISTSLRKKLTTEGVNGYQLKEYGTLVMNQANMKEYPLVKGGEKTSSGMAYGLNADGDLEDNIYETVSKRYRFTSVLIGIPTSQYRTEFAFRGYAVLEKNGKEIIIYGPVVAKSIYALAEQVLKMGTYEEGSDAYKFLKKIIKEG